MVMVSPDSSGSANERARTSALAWSGMASEVAAISAGVMGTVPWVGAPASTVVGGKDVTLLMAALPCRPGCLVVVLASFLGQYKVPHDRHLVG
ncbi:hypothetical protein CT3_28540 [Comamonas terrigena NBRC 13299]|nr:hypothetical protein CT3_28540 [Comamonas terrigena NBRC 13299]